MSDLPALIKRAAVKHAVVVDDAFDEVPIASDLIIDHESWTQFFDDLTEVDRKLIIDLFPKFETLRADELPSVDEFIAILWATREKLAPQTIGPLFDRYILDKKADLAYLDTLLNSLSAVGISCSKAGRKFDEQALNADLIVIDLFLGPAQDEKAISLSIEGLLKVIQKRRSRPPLVVLMSRSSRLEEKHQEFRDKSALSECVFRFIMKSELGEPGRLTRLLTRLVGHYPDALKLAAFHEAWRLGVERATERTSALLRTLDIPDYAQIKQLLLGVEGEPLGSYLVDVFDLVLKHEIEREGAIIDGAIELNKIDSESYPPPYVAGSPDLQSLVFRSNFQNIERLRLMPSNGSRVAFGDLLRRKKAMTVVTPVPGQAVENKQKKPLAEIDINEVRVVLTPACDLQRKEAKGVLLLSGALHPLKPVGWSYKDSPVRTPIVEFANGERFWIKWNLKQIETITHDDLDATLLDDDGFSVVARFRESHALELQQQLLASLGRVGLIAQLPGTFPTLVEAYMPAPDRKLFRLDGAQLSRIEAVCFVGRTGEKDMRLILREDDCEAICRAIQTIDLSLVHPDAHGSIQALRSSDQLLKVLERGIPLPSPNAQDPKEIKIKIVAPGGVESEKTVGFLRRGEPLPLSGKELTAGDVKKAGIYIAVFDQESTV